MSAAPTLHAAAVALWRGGAWRAVLLRGPSGAGKSDLALRAIAAGWRLVADDRAILWASGGRLYVRAPDRLSGLIEARNLGLVAASPLAFAEVVLVADLAADPHGLERLPEADSISLGGVRVARIDLFAAEPSAPVKLAFALRAATLGAEREPSYQAQSVDEGRSARRGRGGPQED